MYSPSINQLIEALKKLPSVGQHTAQRYVFHWLKSGKTEVNELKNALDNLLKNTKSCEVCWNFSDTNPCPICNDKGRDHNQICVIALVPDIASIEKTGIFKGVYHVLRGNLDADLENISELKINQLLERLNKNKNITEIILALNPDMNGETTMMYLKKHIETINSKIKITRLARGLPMGSDLQYADEITLGSALKNRI
jgi:recombination protein RecR